MEYKKYEYDNYTIHFFNTTKFKSIMVSLILINDLSKESLTKNALLRKLLTISSKNYNNENKVIKKIISLYNSNFGIENIIHNNVVSTDFFIEFLEDRYTENGLLNKVMDYYFDTIFNPNVVDGKFESINFNLAKKSLYNYYDKEKEDKLTYAYKRAYEMLDEEYLRYPTNGYREYLDDLNEENMYEYYKDLFKSANANIFVIGNFDNENMLKIINEKLDGKLYRNVNNYKDNNFLTHSKLKERVEKDINNQSNLIMLYKIINITDRQRNDVLPVFNRIFGLGNDSRLFKNVRENKSLAYDIRSSINRENSILSVSAGINYESKDDVIKSIKNELKNIQDGNITNQELENAKIGRLRILKGISDDNESILYTKISNILINDTDINEKINQLSTVTKQEIIEISKKIQLSIVYILQGEKNEED